MSRWYIRFGIPAVLLAVLFWRTEIWRADEILDDLRWWPALAALLLNLPQLLPLTLRLQFILSRLGYSAGLGALLPLAMFGNMASSLTPAASGEALRPLFYRNNFGVPIYQGAAAVFYERAYSFYLMALSILAALALLFLPGPVLGPAAAVLILSLFHAPARLYPPFARLILWIPRLSMLQRFTDRPAVRSFMEELNKGDKLVAELFGDFRLSLRVSVATYATFFVMALQFWFILEAFNERLALHEAWALLAISYFAGTASAIPLGLGAADGVLVYFLTRFEVGGATGAAVALTVRLTASLPYGIMGLIGYWQATRSIQPSAREAARGPTSAGAEARNEVGVSRVIED